MHLIRTLPQSLSFVCLLAARAAALAQAPVDWKEAHVPSPRDWPAIAYDSVRERVVVFGGWTGNDSAVGFLDDTLEWDGQAWVQRSPASRPSPRRFAVMAYDPARRRTLLFGGASVGGSLMDTWEWDGANWLRRLPAQSPMGRSGTAMAHDSLRGRTVLFGGGSSAGFLADTWE